MQPGTQSGKAAKARAGTRGGSDHNPAAARPPTNPVGVHATTKAKKEEEKKKTHYPRVPATATRPPTKTVLQPLQPAPKLELERFGLHGQHATQGNSLASRPSGSGPLLGVCQ